MLALFASRRFGPLFAVQFLGAFNDNLFRFGLLFLVTYRLLAGDPDAAAQLVTLAGGLFILPFALFSGLAGQVADAVDKARAVRIIKLAEIVIMAAGAAAIWLDSIPAMLAVLFATGLQSTFFGPIKFAIVPQHLRAAEVTGATALIEAGTYAAILSGQLTGGLVTRGWLMAAILLAALFGYAAARAIPPAPPAASVQVQANILKSTAGILTHLARRRHLLLAALAGAWFWLLGIVFTSLFVPLVHGTLHAAEGVANLFVAAFSIGVAVGSLLIGRLLAGRVTAATLPFSLAAMALLAVDLYFAVGAFPAEAGVAAHLRGFLSHVSGLRILADLALLAVAGGAYVVPIYTILMTRSDPAERSRIIAANNILNALFMAAGALGAGALLGAGLSVPQLLLAVGLANLPAILLVRALHVSLRRQPAMFSASDAR